MHRRSYEHSIRPRIPVCISGYFRCERCIHIFQNDWKRWQFTELHPIFKKNLCRNFRPIGFSSLEFRHFLLSGWPFETLSILGLSRNFPRNFPYHFAAVPKVPEYLNDWKSPLVNPAAPRLMRELRGKSLKKLWCCVGGEYHKII